MKTPDQANGGAMPEPPQASDILADYSRLLTLIEISWEIIDDIATDRMTPAEKAQLFNAQNMMSIAVERAQKLDKDLDAYAARPVR